MENRSSVGFGHYVVVIRRQWKTVVTLTILGILCAVGYLILAPVQVTASTLINVNVIVSDPFSPNKANSALLDSTTETQLATSYAVAKAAAATLPAGANDIQTLRDGTAVTTDANATTVRIFYTATTPSLAQAGADAIAHAYISYRQDQAQTKKGKLESQLDDQMLALDKRLATASETQAPSILTQIGSIQSQLNVLSLIDTDGGTVLNPAQQNPVTYKPSVPIVLATGIFGGFVLGLVIAFAINVLDRRVRDWFDVRGAGAGPVLARLQNVRATVPATGGDQDNFRVIRERLLANVNRNLRVLTVIDDSTGSPSDVAANLAVAMAESGTRVSLILMGVSNANLTPLNSGLLLTDKKSDHPATVFKSGRVGSLTVIRPKSLTGGAGADDFVTEFVRSEIIGQDAGGLIILALPPNAPRASRLAAGRLSDSVLLVAECLKTKIDDLARDAAEMADIQSVLSGTVLVPSGRRVVEIQTEKKPSPRHTETSSAKAVGAGSK